MSANKQILIYAFVLFAGLNSASAISQEIEIKGLKLGMSKADVESKFGEISKSGFIYEFTIGGIEGKYLKLKFHEDKLDDIYFSFNSDGFEAVRGAVASKYPALKCKNSTVENRMGASFVQVECNLNSDNAMFSLTRISGDIKTSMLTLGTRRALDEFIEKQKQKQGDI